MYCGGCTVADRSEQQVRATLERLMTADNAGDVDAIAACYAPNAVLLPPAGPPVHGRHAIRRRYQDGLNEFALELRIEVDDLQAGHDWAYCRGTTCGRYIWRDGRTPTVFEDKYLMILRRNPGDWVVATLMWNPVSKANAH